MVKSISKQIKDETEEPLLDKSGESLKKLIIKGKKNGFLLRNECELALENEKFEDKDEFYSKVESLNIQIYEEESDFQTTDDDEKPISMKETEKEQSDGGRTDDPVRMYLKEMGNVELLSRVGEIEIAKRIENGKRKTNDAFSKSFISMNCIENFYYEYKKGTRQLRDFIDLDLTFRNVNGEQEEDFNELTDGEIYSTTSNGEQDRVSKDTDDQENENDNDNDNENENDNEVSDYNEDSSDLSILEKEENLKPIILDNLEKYSKSFKKFKKYKQEYIELKKANKKVDPKLDKKIKNAENSISNIVMNLFINQNKNRRCC